MDPNKREACQELAPFERNHFFTGKLLTTRDFQDEQSYYRGKGQQHNRYLHGTGVVCGLRVVPGGPRRVVVEPGLALDAWGREIVVPEATPLDLPGPEEAGSRSLFAVLEYCEEPAELMPVLVESGELASGETTIHSRIRETFCVALRRGPPEGEDRTSRELCTWVVEALRQGADAVALHALLAQWVSRPCRPCAPDPAVTLARIDLPARGPVTAAQIDNWTHRPLALSTGRILELLLCALEGMVR